MRWLLLSFALLWGRIALAEAQPTCAPPDPNADYFVSAYVDNPHPYVGEKIVYTICRYAPLSPSSFELSLPSFEGFSQGTKDIRSNQDVPFQSGGKQYGLKIQDVILSPTRAGTIQIEPTRLIVSAGQQVEFHSESIVLEVEPLPGGAPSGFHGAVGQFAISAVLDKPSVSVGDPVTLQVTIQGSGNLEQLDPPDLPTLTGWQVFSQNATLSVVGDKVFQWTLIPSAVGMQTIPPLQLVYFDPQQAIYRQLQTAPLTLQVVEGESSVVQVAPNSLGPRNTLPLKPIPPNPSFAEVLPGSNFWLLWFVPLAGVAAVWLGARRRKPMRGKKPARVVQSTALQRAQRRLKAASQARQSSEVYPLIAQAICTYFAARLNRRESDMTREQVQQALSERRITNDVAKSVLNCLQAAEDARYAPVITSDVRPLLAQTLEALKALDALWDTRSR
jgi:hypothetical protein